MKTTPSSGGRCSIVLRSTFRRVVDRIVRPLQRTAREHPERPIVIMVSELGEPRRYRLLLRNDRAQ